MNLKHINNPNFNNKFLVIIPAMIYRIANIPWFEVHSKTTVSGIKINWFTIQTYYIIF